SQTIFIVFFICTSLTVIKEQCLKNRFFIELKSIDF
ncbi:MAG: hypothetical protein ACI976_003107, partial [Aureispira sp.]